MKTKLSTLVDRVKRNNWLNVVRNLGRLETQPCWLCGARDTLDGLCVGCTEDLPWRHVPWAKKLAHVDEVVACFNFAYPIRQLIHGVKFRRDIACAHLLGKLAVRQFRNIDVIAEHVSLYPVPLARGRMLWRGFNQSVELSLPIVQELQIPIDVVSVYKRQSSRVQSTLNAATRKENIRGAFALRRSINDDVTIIFDDVITTGATVSAMAQALRRGGAKRVVVWAIAAA